MLIPLKSFPQLVAVLENNHKYTNPPQRKALRKVSEYLHWAKKLTVLQAICLV